MSMVQGNNNINNNNIKYNPYIYGNNISVPLNNTTVSPDTQNTNNKIYSYPQGSVYTQPNQGANGVNIYI